MKKFIEKIKGVTFVELLMYVAIFLVITPVLLTVSVNTARQESHYSATKQVNADSQFIVERIYDYITDARKVDVANSVFKEPYGRLALVMQDDSTVSIWLDSLTNIININEAGVISEFTTDQVEVHSLYFEEVTDELFDPEIVLAVNFRLNISGADEYDAEQNYVNTANLERGDFDDDGCLDNVDQFPRHVECCGDADEDGACEEMDNCVLVFNPYQEDYDEDGIGDQCDSSVFFKKGECGDVTNEGEGLMGYNCSIDSNLIDLINQVPPMPPGTLKNILMSSSPLSPTVLQAVIDRDPQLPEGHIQQIFTNNTKLPDQDPTNIYQNALNMDISQGVKNQIISAQESAEGYAWQGEETTDTEVIYNVSADQTKEFVRFHDADVALGDTINILTDLFIINATGVTAPDIIVTTQSNGQTDTNAISYEGNSFIDAFGFKVRLICIGTKGYAFAISSFSNTQELTAITFNFGEGSTVLSPKNNTTYTASRFVSYCPGGCDSDCGDVGTGIITGDIITDQCYLADGSYPEWCVKWVTNVDNNQMTPAYIGGTQEGEETVYWEKEFKSLLSEDQIYNLKSITVGGEVAYQRTNAFFCDTLTSSCPMRGTLVGNQDVELFNWQGEIWETVGAMNLDGAISDQQKYEVIYSGADPQRFIGGAEGSKIKARIKFHWDGDPPPGETSAPSFMGIDYFVVHLKW